ncbi:MAG: 4-diphosphocytidyl-2-C-methyl-D-erythritol kinase [Parasphingorhabdus sp.]|jgi:4-diphosphocytidyl-2-C-methyl-D-erythritol kinase|uniref:4-(cytidine 5'-diphospho)-2-C-methyl-D-erythritol kinase n=1 Tax=Parasphingorhabdus sp. TaxID=2709688 RepID=UPI0039E45449
MSDSVSGVSDSETAYAKINLALHVRKRLPDGYHQIETIFAFLDQGDVIAAEAGEGIDLRISGPFADGLSATDNLVLQAANRLAEISKVKIGAQLHLEKRLPVASGIGGGSADAAATLRLLNRFWRLNHSISALAEIARPLGADVPACVTSQTCRGTGIGQDLGRIPDDDLRDCVALLINPLVPVSTAKIFAAWDGVDRGALQEGRVMAAAQSGRNDLQKPAVALAPILTDVLDLLEQCQPRLTRMSGSGATCFALFDRRAEAENAEQLCHAAFGEIWTMIGRFR